MNLIWFFLPVILALGVITSYEDIKFGKIRNKWIIFAILIGTLIYCFLFFKNQISTSHIIKISLFVLFSFIIGFMLYSFKLWSAGDAKLYVCFVILIPFDFYKYVTTDFWPLSIIINSILPIFTFLIFYSIMNLKKKQILIILKKMFSLKRIGMYLLIIFSISWIVGLIFNYFNIRTNLLLNVIGIMVFMNILKKVFPYELNYLLGTISIVRIFLNKNEMIKITFWQNFLLMVLIYALIIFFIRELGNIQTKKQNINYLKESTHPVQFIVKHKSQYFKTEEINSGLNLVYVAKPYGLTKKDINNIQKLHRTGHLHFNTIKIQQTLPFAPFMFAGILLTLIAKGNIIIWIRSLF